MKLFSKIKTFLEEGRRKTDLRKLKESLQREKEILNDWVDRLASIEYSITSTEHDMENVIKSHTIKLAKLKEEKEILMRALQDQKVLVQEKETFYLKNYVKSKPYYNESYDNVVIVDDPDKPIKLTISEEE